MGAVRIYDQHMREKLNRLASMARILKREENKHHAIRAAPPYWQHVFLSRHCGMARIFFYS